MSGSEQTEAPAGGFGGATSLGRSRRTAMPRLNGSMNPTGGEACLGPRYNSPTGRLARTRRGSFVAADRGEGEKHGERERIGMAPVGFEPTRPVKGCGF